MTTNEARALQIGDNVTVKVPALPPKFLTVDNNHEDYVVFVYVDDDAHYIRAPFSDSTFWAYSHLTP